MRGLIGQNRLRRFRLFEPIFSYNFALGLEFRAQYVSVSVSVSTVVGSWFHEFQVQLMLHDKGATSYFQAGTTCPKVLGVLVQHTDS